MKQPEIIEPHCVSSIPSIDRIHKTYQIFFTLSSTHRILVGRLGEFTFPAGDYVYTGSARRNLRHRIARHLSKDKKLKWHIDYLLSLGDATTHRIELSTASECEANAATPGRVVVPGFGASDCTSKCVSHLKFLEK